MVDTEKQFTYHRKVIAQLWCNFTGHTMSKLCFDKDLLQPLYTYFYDISFLSLYYCGNYFLCNSLETQKNKGNVLLLTTGQTSKNPFFLASHWEITLVSSFTKLHLFFGLRMSMEVTGVTTCQHHNLKCPLRSCIVPVYNCVVSWHSDRKKCDSMNMFLKILVLWNIKENWFCFYSTQS